MLSLEKLSREADNGTQSDDNHSDDYASPAAASQKPKRSRKGRGRTSVVNTEDTVVVDQESQFVAPSQSQSRLSDPNPKPDASTVVTQTHSQIPISAPNCQPDVGTVVNNVSQQIMSCTTCSASNAVLLQHLSNQQQCIAVVESKLACVLTYLQHISEFLGVELPRPGEGSVSLHSSSVSPVVHNGVMLPTDSNLPAASNVLSKQSSNLHTTVDPASVLNIWPSVANADTAEVPRKNQPGQPNKLKKPDGNLKGLILDAIYKDSIDREKRAKAVVISGIMPSDEEGDQSLVYRLLKNEFDYSPGLLKCLRLGRHNSGHIQPLLVTLPAREDAAWLVANSASLRNSSDPWTRDRIFINHNLSFAERRSAYEQRCQRRATRSAANNAQSESIVFRSQQSVQEVVKPAMHGHDESRPIRVIINSNHSGNGRKLHGKANQPLYNLDNLVDFPCVTHLEDGASRAIVTTSTLSAGPATETTALPVPPSCSSTVSATSLPGRAGTGAGAGPGSGTVDAVLNVNAPEFGPQPTLAQLSTACDYLAGVSQFSGVHPIDRTSDVHLVNHHSGVHPDDHHYTDVHLSDHIGDGPSSAGYSSHAIWSPACLNAPPVSSSISSRAGGTVQPSTEGRLC